MVQEADICALWHFTKGMAVQLLVAQKDRASSRWVAVPHILLHTSVTSCLNRQLIVNAVIWYKCLLSIHGTVSFRKNPVLVFKHGNAVEVVKDVVSNAALIKTDTVLRTFWTTEIRNLKKWSNFTRWRTRGAKNKHRLRTECNRHHCAVCSYCDGTPAGRSRKYSVCF